jgi:exodeoxyribonuclease III
MVKIATWNVNSLRVRLPHVLDWLAAEQPDVLALQETKLADDDFPRLEIEAAGYQVVHHGQKTYNGVAILSRGPLADVSFGIAGFEDPQRRVLAATYGGVRVVDVYVPNGESVGSDKFAYKLDWLERLRRHLVEELERHPRLVLVGDFNIAPEERDVHDPALWDGRVLFSGPERAALRELFGIGLADSFRLFEQPERQYSWWDYRMNAFRRKMGLRIDHILISAPLRSHCVSCRIDIEPRRRERPSDHAPVVAAFEGL